jgi:hypothetical protein
MNSLIELHIYARQYLRRRRVRVRAHTFMLLRLLRLLLLLLLLRLAGVMSLCFSVHPTESWC